METNDIKIKVSICNSSAAFRSLCWLSADYCDDRLLGAESQPPHRVMIEHDQVIKMDKYR